VLEASVQFSKAFLGQIKQRFDVCITGIDARRSKSNSQSSPTRSEPSVKDFTSIPLPLTQANNEAIKIAKILRDATNMGKVAAKEAVWVPIHK
jgi:hypothetical protein